MTRSDLAREIRESFRDPRALVVALGLKQDPRHRSQHSAKVLCPIHAERSASCSVTNGPDGTVRFRCFGCDASGDALTLIAAARSLNLKGQFREVLAAACEVGGLWSQLAELEGGTELPRGDTQPRPTLPTEPERAYPDARELETLWGASSSVCSDRLASAELWRRGLVDEDVAQLDLARVIPYSGLPRWAWFQGQNWNSTGHRMIVRTFDAEGAFRSVRAWRITDGDTPKRLPPAGARAGELVLANPPAVAMLRAEPCASQVIITEGEPDWLVRSMLNPATPVIGIGSGSWHAGFAARVPYGSEVVVRTHRDRAGDGYAQKVLESVRDRARVYRLTIEEETEAA